jgi:FMN phosphatase YigB (HAD superfamily)
MVSNNEIIILDGDDTLWKTQEQYDSAKTQFRNLLKTQGFPENNIIELLDEQDAKRVEIVKFSKTRFFESMLITYAFLCGKHNKKWDVSIESKIRKLGFSVFTSPKLYDDTLPAIKMLSEHFNLILFTHGAEEIQKEKIDSLGKKFKSFFLKI